MASLSSDEDMSEGSTGVSATSTYGRVRRQYSEGYNKPPVPTSGYAVYILVCFDFMDLKTGPATMQRSYDEWSEYFLRASQRQGNGGIIPKSVVDKGYKVEKMYKVGKTTKGLRRYFGKYPAVSIHPPGKDLWLFQSYVQFKTGNTKRNDKLQHEIEKRFNKEFLRLGYQRPDGEGGVEIVFNKPLAEVQHIVYRHVLEYVNYIIAGVDKTTPTGQQKHEGGMAANMSSIGNTWTHPITYLGPALGTSYLDEDNKSWESGPVLNQIVELNPHTRNRWWKGIYDMASKNHARKNYTEMFNWLSNVGITLLHFPDFGNLDMEDTLIDRGDISDKDRPRYLQLRDFMRDYVAEANKAALNHKEGETIEDIENPPATTVSTSQRNALAYQQEQIRETTEQRETAKRRRHEFSRDRANQIIQIQKMNEQIHRLETTIRAFREETQRLHDLIGLHYRLDKTLKTKVDNYLRAQRARRGRGGNSLIDIEKLKF